MNLKMSCGIATALLLGVFATSVQAKTCQVSIDSNDQMQFDQEHIAIAADCTQVELTLKHVGAMPADVMGHNWVLTQTSDLQAVASAGMAAGADKHYVPEDDARVIAFTKVIGGGQSDTITFSTSALKPGGDYSFFCSFPGHWAIMKGKLVFG